VNKHLNKHSGWYTRVNNFHCRGLIVAQLFKKLSLVMEGRGYIHHNKSAASGPNADFF
jgi:hypothetical protein